ncbi:MAG TPA: asparagine synthase-related protein, partial [Allosphingosinicella sp.]|nr:asparagine synthase-related protein [Allosphingosinicella sp.]
MTALAGFWAFGGADEPRGSVERMLRAQQIYGKSPPALWGGGDIALGRSLFSTLPEDRYDRGPVIGGGGRWVLAADIRLDDREGLSRELGVDRAECAMLADASLAMRAVERWGDEAIGRLVGDFALALWDAREKRLILARDFIGQRPLHYHRGGRFFALASTPRGLQALPDVPPGPDARAVEEFLALMPETGTGSFFDKVERVLPGEMLIATATRWTRSRHWSFAGPPLSPMSGDDCAEAVREITDRAVAARLRGTDRRVGAHLSGGLDSSAVAATAARLSAPDGRVTAFTSVPPEGFEPGLGPSRFADEGPHAAAVAALYPNMEHVLVRTAGRSPVENLDRAFFLYQRPVLNICNLVWHDAILDEAKSRGLGVLLTGQLGNMSFSYSGLDTLPGYLSRGRIARLARETAALRRNGLPLKSIASHALGPFVPRRLWRAINRWAGRPFQDVGRYSALRAERAEALASEAAASGLDFAFRPWKDPLAMRLRVMEGIDFGNYNKGYLAGWGIDVRDPTADRRLVELCLSIPPAQYLVRGETRAVARRAFSDRLPPIVTREIRKGMQGTDWHLGLTAAWAEVRD